MTTDNFNKSTATGFQWRSEDEPESVVFSDGNYAHFNNSVVRLGPRNSLVPAAARESLSEKFERLSIDWQRETESWSSLQAIFEHPAYLEIIRLGAPIVPLLLRDLEKKPQHWFYALRVITGASPIPADAAGNLRIMAAAWLDWGKKKKII